MKTVSEFYRNLPKKICVNCGCEIEEQHESYMYECDHCVNLAEE